MSIDGGNIIFDSEQPRIIAEANKILKRLKHLTEDQWHTRSRSIDSAVANLIYTCKDCGTTFCINKVNRNGKAIFAFLAGQWGIALFDHEFNTYPSYSQEKCPAALYCKRYRIMV
jgi:hypothetical protein